ncbi:hypothetical protein PRZ48_002790 [Zasmidium cellare]|uniref:ribonuclease Z n=1 Tax=Zasmidium cellare TaxID=395010 RepID=A0ABR0EUK0_ZASCE|nr:hypothetical protein PRZ48_002790 [Zasmidium cellare]
MQSVNLCLSGTRSCDESNPAQKPNTISALRDLLSGHSPPKKQEPGQFSLQVDPAVASRSVATLEPKIRWYIPTGTPSERWYERTTQSLIKLKRSDDESRQPFKQLRFNEIGHLILHEKHRALLKPRYPAFLKDLHKNVYKHFVRRDFVSCVRMRSFVQILTTPTADTLGTTLILHFDNKRYLIGSLAEGTQRACVQMGARLLKVSECFLTGRTEWKNTGGLIGMILTLADSSSASQASSLEDALKKARSKAKRLGIEDDREKMRELEEEAKQTANTLSIYGPPNLNHTLATARRYVFRKGMPVNVHEIRGEQSQKQEGKDEWAPFWADENVKVWAMSISPSKADGSKLTSPSSISPRKRSIDEVEAEENETPTATDDKFTPDERNYLTVKAVVSEMFNSTWRLDTLYETLLSEVKLPATIFIRNWQTNKIERYTGPMPDGKQDIPDRQVLVRKPWPGALVESLPPTQPAKEAVSYIFRNHMQRGKFHPERAKELKVKPGSDYRLLANGESVVNEDGETITSDMVLDPSRVGGGIAVIDLPGPEYIDNLISRPEWREPKVMEGVGAVVWICGKDVATDPRLHSFMQEFKHLEHVVSSAEYSPNNLTLDSASAATVRLQQVDPERYGVPVHDSESSDGLQPYGGNVDWKAIHSKTPLPDGVHVAARGQTVQLEPSIEFKTKEAIKPLQIPDTIAEIPKDVMEEAVKAQEATKNLDEDTETWFSSLPPGAEDAEIITLGTGSALPSKYRNVSATLVRVPGWGNILLDAGENTLGQLRRVFTADEMKQVLQDLKIISISHMHADHQLGTTSVVKAWYEEVHGGQPAPPIDPTLPGGNDYESIFKNERRLAIVAEPAMLHWLAEYSAVEDYGHSRIAPLSLTPVDTRTGRRSKLGWFVSTAEMKTLSWQDGGDLLARNTFSPSLLNLSDIQAVGVKHCHGARAVSITLPSGFKVSYSGDCRPSRPFAQIGKDSTVCIHEATFDDELQGDAEAKNHSTTSEALNIAQLMRSKACVLTHFSQRYQKVPVLERGEGEPEVVEDVPMTEDGAVVEAEESANPEDGLGGPLEDAAATFPDQETTDNDGKQYDLPSKKASNGASFPTGGPPESVKFKLTSDMKVCVAFDYMRVKVGDMWKMEKFTPALLKLFAEEEKEKEKAKAGLESQHNSVKEAKKKKKGGQRNN